MYVRKSQYATGAAQPYPPSTQPSQPAQSASPHRWRGPAVAAVVALVVVVVALSIGAHLRAKADDMFDTGWTLNVQTGYASSANSPDTDVRLDSDTAYDLAGAGLGDTTILVSITDPDGQPVALSPTQGSLRTYSVAATFTSTSAGTYHVTATTATLFAGCGIYQAAIVALDHESMGADLIGVAAIIACLTCLVVSLRWRAAARGSQPIDLSAYALR